MRVLFLPFLAISVNSASEALTTGRILQGHNLRDSSYRGIAQTVCTMAHLAFCFIDVGSRALWKSRRGERCGEADPCENCEIPFQKLAPCKRIFYLLLSIWEHPL